MILGRANVRRFWLSIAIFSVPFVSFFLAGWLRFYLRLLPWESKGGDLRAYEILSVVATIIWVLIGQQFQLVECSSLVFLRYTWRNALAAWFLSVLCVSAATFFYRDILFSRIFFVLASILWLCLALAILWLFKRATLMGRKSIEPVRVAIIGTEPHISEFKSQLEEGTYLPCQVVASVDFSRQSSSPTEENVEWERFQKIWPDLALDDILAIWSPTAPPARYSEIISFSKLCSAPVRLLLHLDGAALSQDDFLYFLGYPVLGITGCPGDSFRYVVVKRMFDIAFAAAVLILLSPLILFVALVIKLTSHGPVFYSQERVGINGKRFSLYKFRTMYLTDQKEHGDLKWTVREDPRCTPIGRWLRRFSIDELPQFWNVLKGDMSVVGPRPERPFFVEKFLNEISEYNNRHHIRSGITGWAQVNGWRGDTSIEKRVEYDLYYMRNWNVWFDFRIIFFTLLRLFRDPNAY